MSYLQDKYFPQSGFSSTYEDPNNKLVKAVKDYCNNKITQNEFFEINQKHDKHFKIKEMNNGGRIGSLLFFTNNKTRTDKISGCRIPGIVVSFNNDIIPTKERCLDDGWEIIYERPWICGTQIGTVTLLSEFGTFEVPQQHTSGYGGDVSVFENLVYNSLAHDIYESYPMGHTRVEFDKILMRAIQNPKLNDPLTACRIH